jgi:hypothetical protein
MPESSRSRLLRWKFNLVPAYRGTGARIAYLAGDFREVRIRLPLSWRTRNVVGTIFGGSMYGAVDPIFMIMLIRLLGPDYVVWDKTATIRFRRPGRTTLHATFIIDEAELDAIRAATADGQPIDRTYHVDLVDDAYVVHAAVEKVIYVKRIRR